MHIKKKKIKNLIITSFIALITTAPEAQAMGFFCKIAKQFSQQKSLRNFSIKKPEITISDFDYTRDAQAIIKLYNDNWDLLADRPKSKSYFCIDESRLKQCTKIKNIGYRYEGKFIIKVLYYNNELAGFAMYQIDFDEGYVECLCINDNFRRQGLGEKLLKYSMDDIFKGGNDAVCLATKKDNQKSISFYEKIGFKQTSSNRKLIFLTYNSSTKNKKIYEL